MAGKLVKEGRINIMTWFFPNIQTSRGADSLYLGLYTDTVEPAITDTLSTITELALAGYSRIQLLDADWSVDTEGQADNVLKTFTAAIDWNNVYGSFITDLSVGLGTLIAVKHFSNGPYNILNGKTVDITPALLLT